MKGFSQRFLALAAFAGAVAVLATTTQADPLPNRNFKKFSQRPMWGTVITDTTGVQNTYEGHDELSTAYAFNNAAAGGYVQYDGKFMADDFADNLSSPVIHVKWWGSYRQDLINVPVNKFLIAFESDIPANQNPAGYSMPGTVLQTDIVQRANVLTPGSGLFTETKVRGPDAFLNESLYEYNAELHLNNAFFENKDTVYWLKIAALIDVPGGIQQFPVPSSPYNPPPNITQWGWHNRDYTIQDAFASPNVAPGEFASVNPVDGATVWHFQDDAVQGDLRFMNVLGTPNFGITQNNMVPTNYLGNGIDGASHPGQMGIETFSKDLAFELFTFNPPIVPEPTSGVLAVCGAMSLLLARRRRSAS